MEAALPLQEEEDYWISPSRLPAIAPVIVTVVIPNYCAAATLNRAVQSVRDQSLADIEIIIVDDASTDTSWSLIDSLLEDDMRIRAVRHHANRGKPVAMNRAIAHARGRWLAVLDADDWYHPHRLTHLVTIGERWGADMVADNQHFHDGPANTLVGTAWPPGAAAWELSFDDFLLGANAYETFNLGMLKPVLRLDFMRRVGLCYEEQARQGQDFFHLLQFYLARGRAVICDTPYYFYTQPFGVVSRRWSHATRKRYDFQKASDINERHLVAALPFLSPQQSRRLRGRNAQLRRLESYYCAKDALARRHWREAALILLRHPTILAYLLRRLRNRLTGRPGYFRHLHRIARQAAARSTPPATGGLDAR